MYLDNTFNSLNFAFSIATIINFFDLGTFLGTHGLKVNQEVHLCQEFDFVTPRISDLLQWGI